MICPVDLASDLSALQAARVGDHRKPGLLLPGRDGAGDEGTGSHLAGDGEKDHVVASGGDHRHQRPVGCGAGGSAMKSTGMTGCLTGGVVNPRPSGCRWPWWSRYWGCIGSVISI